MDNANKEGQVGANFVTDSNEEEGFAHAIEKFVLIRISVRPVISWFAVIPVGSSGCYVVAACDRQPAHYKKDTSQRRCCSNQHFRRFCLLRGHSIGPVG